MNKRGFILLVVVVLLMLWILYKVQTAQRLTYQLGTPQQISVRSGALTFIMPIRVGNNSQGSVRVKSADFDVKTSGSVIGRAEVRQAVTIAPKGTTIMPVSVTINLLDAATAASGFWNSLKQGVITLEFDGTVSAELFVLPVKESFELRSKLLSDFAKLF